ncbi:hypothetical protein Tco_0795442 [Tanacetum coccineum]
MGWVMCSDAVLESHDTVLIIVVMASRCICDAVSSHCREILEPCWCRSVVLSVSSPNEPKSLVFPQMPSKCKIPEKERLGTSVAGVDRDMDAEKEETGRIL